MAINTGMWYKDTVVLQKSYFILFLFDKVKLNDFSGQV